MARFMTLNELDEMEGGKRPGLRPFLCRVGSKARFTELLNHIMPEHSVYIEPFIGSGAFYWSKPPVKKEYINDLDRAIATSYRIIKHAPKTGYPINLDTRDKLKSWFLANKATTKPAIRLTHLLIEHCNGWMGKQVNKNTGNVQRGTNPYNKLKHITDYAQRMKTTTVLSEDYAKVLKHATKDSFTFMDPPYEESEGFGYAEGLNFDFERFARTVKGMPGKWLITINDSPYIRELFSDYEITPIIIKGHVAKRTKAHHGTHIGSRDRKEILISNYNLPTDWRQYKGAYIK